MSEKVQRRVWKFGDRINSDLILPGHALYKPMAEQRQYVFEANRPGWVSQVKEGDVIVAGLDFGVGSGRPTPRVLKEVGVSAVLADSFNGLFFRNAVNFGLPLMQFPGISALFEEMDGVELDFDGWRVRNLRTDRTIEAIKLPGTLKSTMLKGGVIPFLVSNGYVRANP